MKYELILNESYLSESSLGGWLLAGPGEQELASLATVVPNWTKVPESLTRNLQAMDPSDVENETPFSPDLEFLIQFQLMIEEISKDLLPKPQ